MWVKPSDFKNPAAVLQPAHVGQVNGKVLLFMNFEHSEKVQQMRTRLGVFMDEYVYPNEAKYHEQIREGERWAPVPIVEELKEKAAAAGLWNLFLPESEFGPGSPPRIRLLFAN